MLRDASDVAATSLEADVVDGTHAVDPAEWDALVAPGQGPLRHGFVGAWERGDLADLHCRPVLVRGADGRAVAAAHAYRFDLDMAGAHAAAPTRLVAAARRVWPRLLVARVLEMGSPTPLVKPFLCASGVPLEAAAETVLDALAAEADGAGTQLTIVQNFEPSGPRGGVASVLERRGFASIPIPPAVIVQLPFASFDEYLGAMRAQYRRRAHKVLERSSHLRVERLRDFGELAPELARLWRLVWERADDLKREVLPEGFFRAASELDYVTVLALRRGDGTLASYALLLEDEPWLHFLYTGFEREAGEREGAYFRLIYEIVRYGIERGFSCANLGMTTLEPKLDAGGAPLPLTAWIRHRRSPVQRLIVRLGRGPFAPARASPRRVFKG